MPKTPLIILPLLLAPGVSRATCHLMDIVEVFAGTSSEPNAHYVVLQMTFGGQQFVSGTSITVNAGTFGTFGANVTSCTAANCKILMATSEAQALFSITADGTASGSPLLATPTDTVTYSCSLDTVTYGGGAVPDLIPGCALHKNGSVWSLGDPTPANNAGATGSLPGACVIPDGGLAEPAADLGGDLAPPPDLGPDAGADVAPPPDLSPDAPHSDHHSPDSSGEVGDDDGGGCSCHVAATPPDGAGAWIVLALAAAAGLVRRSRR